MTQPAYNIHRGHGVYIKMTYRVIPGSKVSQFHTEAGWQGSSITEHTLRAHLPLVAKNVRFKA